MVYLVFVLLLDHTESLWDVSKNFSQFCLADLISCKSRLALRTTHWLPGQQI